MEELYKLGIRKSTIIEMIELNPNIKDIDKEDVINKVNLLKGINCSETEVRNIISSNPKILSKNSEDIASLIIYLSSIGFKYLNYLIDSNPYILNKDTYEIKNYIDSYKNIEEVIDKLEMDPFIFNEI